MAASIAPQLAPDRPRLLVVEDDVDIRESMQEVLSDEGFEVDTALNGLDGLIWIERHGLPDVVLLDLTMPVMSGQEFLNQLRHRGLLERVAVIVVSAVAFRATPGTVGTVPKPINFGVLLQTIRGCCERLATG